MKKSKMILDYTVDITVSYTHLDVYKRQGKIHYINKHGEFKIGLLPAVYEKCIEYGIKPKVVDMRQPLPSRFLYCRYRRWERSGGIGRCIRSGCCYLAVPLWPALYPIPCLR